MEGRPSKPPREKSFSLPAPLYSLHSFGTKPNPTLILGSTISFLSGAQGKLGPTDLHSQLPEVPGSVWAHRRSGTIPSIPIQLFLTWENIGWDPLSRTVLCHP